MSDKLVRHSYGDWNCHQDEIDEQYKEWMNGNSKDCIICIGKGKQTVS